MSDANSVYKYNSAIQGSVYYLDSSTLSIDGIEASNSFAAYGGVIYVNVFSALSVKNSIMVDN